MELRQPGICRVLQEFMTGWRVASRSCAAAEPHESSRSPCRAGLGPMMRSNRRDVHESEPDARRVIPSRANQPELVGIAADRRITNLRNHKRGTDSTLGPTRSSHHPTSQPKTELTRRTVHPRYRTAQLQSVAKSSLRSAAFSATSWNANNSTRVTTRLSKLLKRLRTHRIHAIRSR